MTRFVLCGSGWRSEFFLRVCSALPDEFEIVSVYTRHPERKEALLSRGFNALCDLSRALSFEHDAVIVAGGKEGFLQLLKELSSRGETILSETTFLSLGDKELDEASLIPGYTLEQYWHTPLYASIKKALPLIGRVQSVYLSALHNHHAASIMRGIFPDKEIKEIKRLYDSSYSSIKTGSRRGMERGGEMEEVKRAVTGVTFTSGEVFVTDFSSSQYHSYIIPSEIEIRGERGYITEKEVVFISPEGYPVREEWVFYREENKINHTPVLSHVTLSGAVVFENPFYNAPFSDDEIAIAAMLREFSHSTLTYTIRDGVEDARIGKYF